MVINPSFCCITKVKNVTEFIDNLVTLIHFIFYQWFWRKEVIFREDLLVSEAPFLKSITIRLLI